jgi:hypothetical protein
MPLGDCPLTRVGLRICLSARRAGGAHDRDRFIGAPCQWHDPRQASVNPDGGQGMESLARVSASRKTGAEPFTAAGRPAGVTVADFWGWSRSDLLDNTERGVLAEFIVATALGIPPGGVREGWAAWDLTTPDGIRVEVKSAAYLQSWAQKELSRISFGTPRTLAWDADGGGFAGAARRHAQVYVFALLAHTDKATVDPLDLDQWVFYVLPTAVLDGRTRSQHSITLKTLQGLTAAVGFGEVCQAVHEAAEPAGPS